MKVGPPCRAKCAPIIAANRPIRFSNNYAPYRRFGVRAGQERCPRSPDARVAEPFHSVSLLFTKVPFVVRRTPLRCHYDYLRQTARSQSHYVVENWSNGPSRASSSASRGAPEPRARQDLAGLGPDPAQRRRRVPRGGVVRRVVAGRPEHRHHPAGRSSDRNRSSAGRHGTWCSAATQDTKSYGPPRSSVIASARRNPTPGRSASTCRSTAVTASPVRRARANAPFPHPTSSAVRAPAGATAGGGIGGGARCGRSASHPYRRADPRGGWPARTNRTRIDRHARRPPPRSPGA